jgi:hypothetical protein
MAAGRVRGCPARAARVLHSPPAASEVPGPFQRARPGRGFGTTGRRRARRRPRLRCTRAREHVRNSERSHRRGADGRCEGAQVDRNRCACRRGTAPARHTHESAAARCASASAGAAPNRTATDAPSATSRLSSVVSTRRRSKRASVNDARRSAFVRSWPGGIGGVPPQSIAPQNAISPLSRTINRAPALQDAGEHDCLSQGEPGLAAPARQEYS